MANKFKFNEVLQRVEQTKREVPIRIANLTQNYFVRSFRLQAWDGKQWQEVQRRIEGTPEFKYPKKKGLSRRTKPIGVMSGRMRRETANSIRVAQWPTVRLVQPTPYAEYFNNGTEHSPARPFMGQTKELQNKQVDVIEKSFNKIWHP